MNEELVFAQQCIGDKNPEMWEDLSVPLKIQAAGSPNVTVEEWGNMLAKNTMAGCFRAYTADGAVYDIMVSSEKVYTWKAELKK